VATRTGEFTWARTSSRWVSRRREGSQAAVGAGQAGAGPICSDCLNRARVFSPTFEIDQALIVGEQFANQVAVLFVVTVAAALVGLALVFAPEINALCGGVCVAGPRQSRQHVRLGIIGVDATVLLVAGRA
jgi:hypothetical protein